MSEVYPMRGPDPTRQPVVASPLLELRSRSWLGRLATGCLVVVAALITANAIDPGALDGVDARSVAGFAAIEVALVVAFGVWEVWVMRRRLRDATPAVAVTAPPPEEGGSWRGLATSPLLVFAGLVAAVVAFDAAVFVCAVAVVGIVGVAIVQLGTAMLVSRDERRRGRRYYQLPQGDDEPAIVWTPALPFSDAWRG